MDDPTTAEFRRLDALLEERDRRYTREAELTAEALRVRQEADKEALALAREGQTYRDEQANRLREQIAQERTEAREREARLLTKEEYDRRHDDLLKEVARVATVQAEGGATGRKRLSDRAFYLAIAGLALTFLAVLVTALVALL